MTPYELDQTLAVARDTIPRHWWALYQGSLAAGFGEQQAMALLQTQILSQFSGGVYPPKPYGEQSKEE